MKRNGEERSGKKRRDTFMLILKHKFRHTYVKIYTVTYIKRTKESKHTNTQTYFYTCIHVCPPLNMH